MKSFIPLAALTVVLICCKAQQGKNEIVIEGHVQNIPDGKVYLTDAHRWQIPLDSTESKNGYFVFRIKTEQTFKPYKASVSFPDFTKQAKIQQFLYRNHMRNDSMNHYNSAFLLEEGLTKIEGNITQKPYLRVYGSSETDAYYSTN